MLVYRVEHPSNGHGPYHWQSPIKDALNDDHEDSSHPGPWQERELKHHFESGIHVCALSTIERLTAWFDGWLRPLHTQGFVISVYDTFEDVKVSRATGQCVFDKDFATLVQSKPIFPTE